MTSQPIEIDIPHKLGRDAAKERISTSFGRLAEFIPGGHVAEHRWTGDRLDFTVVGPAVNEVSRIVSMCRSVDRSVVASSAFFAATPLPQRESLVSVGRYALRGVGRAQELFTLDPEIVRG